MNELNALVIMKIGIISDIHGNIFGLKAIVAELEDCDRIICCGDITGYYMYANEVFDLLQSRNVLAIIGNHDQYLLTDGYRDKGVQIRLPLEYTRDTIEPEHMDRLRSFPERREFSIENKRVLLTHGSPWNNLEEYVYPDYAEFDRFASLEYDIVLLGHTHYPMLRNCGGVIVVNPGSCGQPRDYNPDVSGCIWDTESNIFTHFRKSYDKSELLTRISELGFPESLAGILVRMRQEGPSPRGTDI